MGLWAPAVPLTAFHIGYLVLSAARPTQWAFGYFSFAKEGLASDHTPLPAIFPDCIYKEAVAFLRGSWMESVARSAEEACSRSSLAPLTPPSSGTFVSAACVNARI